MSKPTLTYSRRGGDRGGASDSATRPRTLGHKFSDSELIIGLVGAVGTDQNKVIRMLEERLTAFGYTVDTILVSDDIIKSFVGERKKRASDEYQRITKSMNDGNRAREKSGDNSILALGTASWIAALREKDKDQRPQPLSRRAFLIKSLKHPDEVARLREIYPLGFYLLGVYSDDQRRRDYLEKDRRIDSPKQIQKLMDRDANENLPHGQRLTDTFHLADFFVWINGNDDRLKKSVWRLLDLLFGYPYITPTFDEYAMFLAFGASLRSADLSRQVGAVIADNHEIIATGANDCPRAGGGLYWPVIMGDEICDEPDGRDYTRKRDQNWLEQQSIIEEIIRLAKGRNLKGEAIREDLEQSRIRDITEFGRVVHAEMEALLSCSRNNISCREASLYCTTYPCHNCAKHIVAAGIARVVYIEPYPKSKASEFHADSIVLGIGESPADGSTKVRFEPFVGVGPRMFFDLFSMRLGSGWEVRRKTAKGATVDWLRKNARLRLQMLPSSYLDLELEASKDFKNAKRKKR